MPNICTKPVSELSQNLKLKRISTVDIPDSPSQQKIGGVSLVHEKGS